MLTPDEDRARRARARECAIELLELSRVYEDVTIPPGCPVEWPIIVAIVARQRSHLKAISGSPTPTWRWKPRRSTG